MGEYHNHYLEKDIFLLANVFEKFIDTCLKFYKLNPCPGLHWDTMLIKNDWCEIKKISDIHM